MNLISVHHSINLGLELFLSSPAVFRRSSAHRPLSISVHHSTVMTWRRLEVPSMWIELEDNNNSSSVKNLDNNISSGHFKGKIIIADSFFLHEIYNSKTLDSLYTDFSSTNKRKMEDFIAEHMDLRSTSEEEVEDDSIVSEHTDLPSKNVEEVDDDSVVSEHTVLPSTTEEIVLEDDSVVSEKTDLPLNEKEMKVSVGPRKISLPVMGPERGMLVMPQFHVIVHKDSGNPETEKDHINQAQETIFGGCYTLWDDVIRHCDVDYIGYDKMFNLTTDLKFGELRMDCIVYNYCKVVHLEIQWLKPNNDSTTDDATDGATDDSTDDDMDDAADYGYLSGSLTVTNDIYEDIVSVLLDTPPKKVVKVMPGKPIPLLKSVVVVPFLSDFTVNAQLKYSDNSYSAFDRLVEKGKAIFPVEDEDEDFETSEYTYPKQSLQSFPFYKSTKFIDCIDGGRLKVMALVMRDH